MSVTVTVAASALAELLSGQPSLLVLDGLPGIEALAEALPGLRLWRVVAHPGGLRLAPLGDAGFLAGDRPMPAVPAGVLAILASDREAAAPLLDWWRGIGPEVPPVLEAPDAASLWPQLARLAFGEVLAAAGRAAGLHRALVATRLDYEETRTAMTVLMQSSGFRAPMGLETALASEPASPDHAVRTEAGHLALGQVLNLPVDGLAAVALHLAEAEVSPEARLRLRLYGAESGRVLAAWLVPGEALRPGWLALDLPAPVGLLRETACLDVLVEAGPADRLAISLEDATTEPDRDALQDEGGLRPTPLGRALALRLWQAPFGRRFAMPMYLAWEQVDLSLGLPGVPVAMAQQVWSLAQLPLGGCNVALGAASPRPVLRLAPGAEALVVLPQVPVLGLDLLEASIVVAEAPVPGLEVALWLLPAGSAPETPDQLDLAAPGVRCSGWRRLPEDGAGRLAMPLRLPLDGPPALAVVLVARLGVQAPAPCQIEWADLFGRRLGRIQAPEGPPSIRLVTRPRAAECAAVRLQEHFSTPDGGYRHLDLTLEQVRLGGSAWPVLRTKLALNGEVPQLEFRLRADWPVMFEHWPTQAMDQHGPVFLLSEDRAGALLRGLRGMRDAQAIRALLHLLPSIIPGLPREVGDPAPWLEAARRLTEAVGE